MIRPTNVKRKIKTKKHIVCYHEKRNTFSVFTLRTASLFPSFSKARISGDSRVMVICFIPCLSRLLAKLKKEEEAKVSVMPAKMLKRTFQKKGAIRQKMMKKSIR